MIQQDPSTTLAEALARASTAEAEVARLQRGIALEIAAADRRTARKIDILKIIFSGIAALMCFLGVLTFVNWFMPDAVDKDGIGAAYFQMSKDILLVLTGILGSAMASVFDGRSGGSRLTDRGDQQPEQSAADNGG
jgi:hypothetical protein